VPRAAFDIGEMLSVPGIRLQMLEAVEALSAVLGRNSSMDGLGGFSLHDRL
jgi:hypothetical protein